MIDDLPDAPDPANDVPQVFNQKAAAFVLAQKAMVAQINATAGNLNTIAAGGAYAIPYGFWADLTTIGAGNGRLSIQGDPTAATSVYVSFVDSRGINVKNMLTDIFSSGSTVKAYLTITAANDPSRWITYRVTNWGFGVVGVIGVVYSGSSEQYPIRLNDSLVLQITRTGDAGPIGGAPIALIRDQRASGTSYGSVAVNTWVPVVLNTIWANDIGLTLSGNAFTLQPGRYWIESTALCISSSHQSRLFDVTGNSASDYGTNELSGCRSIIRVLAILSTARTFRIERYATGSTANGGSPLSTPGGFEVYAEIKITKVG